MENFVKKNHLEISAGGTEIIASSNCPLSEEEAIDLKNVLEVEGNRVPCCRCSAFVEQSEENFSCPYFDWILMAEDNKINLKCLKIDK